MGKTGKKSVPGSGFDFKFTQGANVKAVVARKRVAKPGPTKNMQKSFNLKGKPTVPKVVEKSPEKSDNSEEFTQSDDGGIQLGICSIPAPKKVKAAKPVPTKNLSKSPKRNEKQGKKVVEESPEKSDNSDDLPESDDGGIQLGICSIPAPKKVKLSSEEFSDKSGVKVFPDKVNQVQNNFEIDHRFDVVGQDPGPKRPQNDNNKVEKKRKKKTLDEAQAEMPEIEQKRVIPIRETVFTGSPMSSINLHPHLTKNLADVLKITELTSIQQRAVPAILEKRDALVRSQTGSGKTLAYALPVVQHLQEIRPKLTRNCGIQAVIVCPTRELVIQTYDLLLKLLRPFTWIICGYLCGGEKRKSEKARLRKGINIMVGTPGRLCDHLTHTESFKLDKAKWLILDEADRLLELGYEKDVRKIVDILNENQEPRQTVLLSATLTPAVEKLAGLTLKDPKFIDNSDTSDGQEENFSESVKEAISGEKLVVPTTIRQTYLILPPKLRLTTLSGLLVAENKKFGTKILVFMATQDLIDFHYDAMVEVLTKKVLDADDEEENEENEANEEEENEDTKDDCYLKGVRFFKLHGSMTQVERKSVFNEFRKAKSGVLLSTDVAARGLDVPEVDVVVQFTPPQKLADYVHRIGRTARAGRSGKAIIFLNPTEVDFIHLLNDKGLKLWPEDFKRYLRPLIVDKRRPNAADEYVSDLQHKYEELINEDKEIMEKACKAFVSWVRFYSAFPKDLKAIFNRRQVHLGHYAKSLGLREPPSSFAHRFSVPKPEKPKNRLTYEHKDDTKEFSNFGDNNRSSAPRSNEKGLARYAAKSRMVGTSEFDSGIPSKKMKK